MKYSPPLGVPDGSFASERALFREPYEDEDEEEEDDNDDDGDDDNDEDESEIDSCAVAAACTQTVTNALTKPARSAKGEMRTSRRAFPLPRVHSTSICVAGKH